MINFDKKDKASVVLANVFGLLDEEHIKKRIDGPIEKAAEIFIFDQNAHITYQNFVRVAGQFVQHLYQHGLRIRQKLSLSQACAEMMEILEAHYQNPHATGFHAAYLDAKNPNLNGIDYILFQLAKIIIQRTRVGYARWVFATQIEPLDWHTKCEIINILQCKQASILPPDIGKCPPAQLADHLFELINVIISNNKIITSVSTADINFGSI